MGKSHHTSLMLAMADGTLLASNATARRKFGSVEGLRCCDVLRAEHTNGSNICSPECPAQVIAGRAQIHKNDTLVRGRLGSMRCEAVGIHLVIAAESQRNGERIARILSNREIEVLRLVAQGQTGRAIASQLGIGPETVRTHIDRARNKLGTSTRPETVARAVVLGLLN